MLNLSGISTLLFDLGGVIINIDYHETSKAFQLLGFEHFADVYTQHTQSSLFSNFETGKTTSEQFRNFIRQNSKQSLTDQQIDDAWNAMIFDFPSTRLKLLKQLKSQYQLVLFSNINPIHLAKVQLIQQQTLAKMFYKKHSITCFTLTN
ncbi:MAG: hypothetical protein ACPGUD_07085 [Parashewanella sp.]